MNIFLLHENPVTAARMLCDKHIVKMPLETAQLLSSVFSVALEEQDGSSVSITDKNIRAPYRLTHKNHPCSVWARESKGNFNWLLGHGKELCTEYTYRYKRKHKSEEVIDWCNNNKNLLVFQSTDMTDFKQALPDKYKCSDAVEAYRKYYLGDKMRFAKWEKGREEPDWVKEERPSTSSLSDVKVEATRKARSREERPSTSSHDVKVETHKVRERTPGR